MMPTKQRVAKWRRTPEVEMRAWSMVFKSGHDYLRELRPYGLRTDEGIRAEARLAWQRYGAAFLQRWEAQPGAYEPWALREFGRPREDALCP